MIQPGHGTVTSGPAGALTISLDADDTDQNADVYFYDITIYNEAGDTQTIAYGPFTIEQPAFTTFP
jgi:hypothetical protein